MTIRDVEVVISRETQAVSQAGFGVPLILSTDKEHQYTTYRELETVAEDFPEETEAYKMASRVFGQNPRPAQIAIIGVDYQAGEGSAEDLVATLNENADQDFYFLLSTEQGAEEIAALSSWVDAQKRMYFYSSDDPEIQQEIESDRTVPLIHKIPESYPAEGWVGVCAPTNPGSITWKFKTINGILEAGFKNGEVESITETGGNTYIRQGGILHTQDGRTTSGEWIDNIRSQDYVEARIKEEVFSTLVNAPKVPFTSAGIAQVTSALETALQSAYNNGIIADDEDGQPLYYITSPKRHEVPDNDRANRTLPDVKFGFQLAGAIHEVKPIEGVIRV